MKKFIVLIMAIFLVFSMSGFSQGKPHKTVQSGKIEQPKRERGKNGRTPRKHISKKKIHKSATRSRGPERQGRSVKM